MQVTVAQVYVGPFMTSLDMAGFSLSLLLLDDARTAALDALTQATLLCPLHKHACSFQSVCLPGPCIYLPAASL